MNKKEKSNAVNFCNDLFKNKIMVKNEEMRDRLSEIVDWRHAFTSLINHGSNFRLKILEKEKLIILAKDYQFENYTFKKLNTN